jgi:hypothetical protein
VNGKIWKNQTSMENRKWKNGRTRMEVCKNQHTRMRARQRYTSPIPETDWGFDEFIQHVHPEDRARAKGDFQIFMTLKETYKIAVIPFDHDFAPLIGVARRSHVIHGCIRNGRADGVQRRSKLTSSPARQWGRVSEGR